jgi:hypothetical protein
VPAPLHRGWLTRLLHQGVESASPTTSKVEKSECFCRCFYIPSGCFWRCFYIPLDNLSEFRHSRRPPVGPAGRSTGASEREIATARQRSARAERRDRRERSQCVGAARSDMRRSEVICSLKRPAARNGERPLGASRRPGSCVSPGTAGSPRPEQLSRAESEACADRASTAIERSERSERSVGASARAARTGPRAPTADRTRSAGQQRGLAPDLEARASGGDCREPPSPAVLLRCCRGGRREFERYRAGDPTGSLSALLY